MDWYELVRPAWYLGEGWALTPEAAGVAARDSRGPGSGGSQGWIRRTPGPVTLMIGGRLLPGGAATSRLRVSIDDRIIDETAVGSGFFLRMLELPSGATAGEGDYARMTVVADSDRVALEQFDAQPAGSVVYGFGEGWHESEYNPSTGESWRWTSDRSAIRVRAAGNALSMAIRGESESGRDVTLTIRVNDAVVATETVGSSFIVNASVPAAALTKPESIMTIETDGSFVPAETRWRSADQRRLGVKILECRITPAS